VGAAWLAATSLVAAAAAYTGGVAGQPFEIEVRGGGSAPTTTPPPTTPGGGRCPGFDPPGRTQLPVGLIRPGATLSTGTGVIVTITAIEARGRHTAGFTFVVAAGSRALASVIVKGRAVVTGRVFRPVLLPGEGASVSVAAGDEPLDVVRLCAVVETSVSGGGTPTRRQLGVSDAAVRRSAKGPLAYTGAAILGALLTGLALVVGGRFALARSRLPAERRLR
jgi:hypothetical protein